MKRWILSGFALLLAGCQTTPIDYQNRLNEQHACCNSVHQLHPHMTELDQHYTFQIGSGDRIETLTVDGQKTFSKKVRLPNFQGPYSIHLATHASHASTFVPRIATLDAEHKVVRVFDREDFRFNRTGYSGTVFVNDEDQDEQYLLIITDNEPEEMPEFTQVAVQTASLPNGGNISWATGDRTTRYQYSLGGSVSLHLQPYSRLPSE